MKYTQKSTTYFPRVIGHLQNNHYLKRGSNQFRSREYDEEKAQQAGKKEAQTE
jgi:hypothetical protein